MHVDLDAFYVSVERVLNPDLVGVPVLVGNTQFGRGVVAAASYEARSYGIHSAMPMARARRLCPEAIVVSGNHSEYERFSRRFMALLEDVAPEIEPLSLDEAFVELTGFERLYGPPEGVGEMVRARVRSDLDLPASVGIGSSKVVAKVASDAAKPDGLKLIPLGSEATFFAPMPLRALPGIGKAAESLLNRSGLKTLGDLQQAPIDRLRALFGDLAVGLQQRALGIDESRVAPRGRAKSISRETTFQEDVTDRALIEATIEHFADRVAGSLRQANLAARTVEVKLRIVGFETYSASETLDHPTQDTRTITITARAALARLVRAHPEPVRLVGVGVSSLGEPADQLSLFAADAAQSLRLTGAVDAVRNRFGFDAIVKGSALNLRDRRTGR